MENAQVNVNRHLISNQKYNFPCFIYNITLLKEQCKKALSVANGLGTVFYAVKANHQERLLYEVVQMGLGLDVSSQKELDLALKVGCPSNKIIMTGPGKTNVDLQTAVENNIRYVVVESLHESERLSKIAHRQGRVQNVLVRINPQHQELFNEDSFNGYFSFGGGPSKYGIDEENIQFSLNYLAGLKNISLQGIHIFSASGILNQRTYLRIFDAALSIFINLKKTYNNLRILDLGGGWGLDYQTGILMSVDDLGDQIKKNIRKHFKFLPKELIFELGTYIAGPICSYFARIIDVKSSRGDNFIIVDGGFRHILRPSIVGPHKINIIAEKRYSNMFANENQIKDHIVSIVGNSCYPLDILARNVNVQFECLENLIGKIVVVENCGAYGEVFSSSSFQKQSKPFTYWESGFKQFGGKAI